MADAYRSVTVRLNLELDDSSIAGLDLRKIEQSLSSVESRVSKIGANVATQVEQALSGLGTIKIPTEVLVRVTTEVARVTAATDKLTVANEDLDKANESLTDSSSRMTEVIGKERKAIEDVGRAIDDVIEKKERLRSEGLIGGSNDTAQAEIFRQASLRDAEINSARKRDDATVPGYGGSASSLQDAVSLIPEPRNLDRLNAILDKMKSMRDTGEIASAIRPGVVSEELSTTIQGHRSSIRRYQGLAADARKLSRGDLQQQLIDQALAPANLGPLERGVNPFILGGEARNAAAGREFNDQGFGGSLSKFAQGQQLTKAAEEMKKAESVTGRLGQVATRSGQSFTQFGRAVGTAGVAVAQLSIAANDTFSPMERIANGTFGVISAGQAIFSLAKGMQLLGLATGPVGLVIGALAIGVGFLTKAWSDNNKALERGLELDAELERVTIRRLERRLEQERKILEVMKAREDLEFALEDTIRGLRGSVNTFQTDPAKIAEESAARRKALEDERLEVGERLNRLAEERVVIENKIGGGKLEREVARPRLLEIEQERIKLFEREQRILSEIKQERERGAQVDLDLAQKRVEATEKLQKIDADIKADRLRNPAKFTEEIIGGFRDVAGFTAEDRKRRDDILKENPGLLPEAKEGEDGKKETPEEILEKARQAQKDAFERARAAAEQSSRDIVDAMIKNAEASTRIQQQVVSITASIDATLKSIEENEPRIKQLELLEEQRAFAAKQREAARGIGAAGGRVAAR